MMEIKLNEKLKQLRSQKGVTQEQLASHLLVSAQAVSKWERGEGYPDITLLPRLALYFGASIDDLFGVNEAYINEQVEEWVGMTDELNRRGEIEQIFDLWDEAYRQYPNHPTVINEYMQANGNIFMRDHQKNRDKGERVIALGEKILAHSTNTADRNHAIQLMAFTYHHLSMEEKAKKYAEMTGSFYTCREVLLTRVLKGEEGIRHRQNFIMGLTDELTQQAMCLTKSEHYATEDKIEIYRYILKLLRSLFTDEDYGFYSTRMSQYSSALAQLYAQIGDRENCLQCLKDTLKFATSHDRTDDHGKERTSLLVNMTVIDRSSVSKNYTETECGLHLKTLQNKCYDFLRDDAEFIKIKQEFEKNA